MKIISLPEQMQKAALALQADGKRIALVPTMGFLHEGHLSLIKLARLQSDIVIVSIFVNPTQFGPTEDFDRYPRDIHKDKQVCNALGVDILFHPSASAMYHPAHTVFVEGGPLSSQLCGKSRPGHFRGVLTVIAKLFHICMPHIAVFGQKDAQQAKLIQLMVRDMNFPIKIVLCPIIREPDGLAMSSRNKYLLAEERNDALCLANALKLAKKLYRAGNRSPHTIIEQLTELICAVPSAKIDYIEIVDAETFQPVTSMEKPVTVLLAVWIGKTRLIDNLCLPDDRPVE